MLLTREYRDELVETFQSILVQTRETHVKNLEASIDVSGPPQSVELYPLLPVEPFPTFYLRTARAYEFVANVLTATMGAEWLASTGRLLEDGRRHTSRSPSLKGARVHGTARPTASRSGRVRAALAGATTLDALATNQRLAASSGYGDGLVKASFGAALRFGASVSAMAEYGHWFLAQNDSGDGYSFLASDVVGLTFAFHGSAPKVASPPPSENRPVRASAPLLSRDRVGGLRRARSDR